MKVFVVLFFLSLLYTMSLSTSVIIRWNYESGNVDHFLIYKSTYTPDPAASLYSITRMNFMKDDVDPNVKTFYRVDAILKDGKRIVGKWFQYKIENRKPRSPIINHLYILSFDGLTLRYAVKPAFDKMPNVKVLLGGTMELDNILLMQKNGRWIYELNVPQYAIKPYLEFHVVSEDENGNRCETLMIGKAKTNVIPYSALYGTYPFHLYVLSERLSKKEYRLVCFGTSTPFVKDKKIVLSNENKSSIDLTPYLYLDPEGRMNLNYHYSSLKEGRYTLKVMIKDIFGNLYEKNYSLFALGNVLFSPNRRSNMKFVLIPPYDYVVQHKDTLYSISVRFNTTVSYLQMINDIRDVNVIYDGEHIKIGKVEFGDSPVLVVVDVTLSKLYVYYNGVLIKQFPVAIGRQDDTPLGTFWIIKKLKNPTLYWKGEIIKPRSPINGLGSMYLQLSSPEYGIHGTTKPWEIGRRISHGCIRMYNEDVEKLAKIVNIGTKVMIIKSDCKMPLFATEGKLEKFISRR